MSRTATIIAGSWLVILCAIAGSIIYMTGGGDRRRPTIPPMQRPEAIVRQLGAGDCGLAAIVTLANLLGRETPIDYRALYNEVSPPDSGLDLNTLVKLAADMGLPLSSVRLNNSALMSTAPPFILHLKQGHYIVLLQRYNREWLVADPKTGLTRRPLALALEMSSGVALIPSISKSIPSQ